MTARDRRALRLGGIAVGVAIVTLRLVPWGVRATLAAQRDLTGREELLARTRADLLDEQALSDSVARVSRAVVGLAPRLLSGGTAAEAGADLSGRVNLASTRHRVKLDRADLLADSSAAGRLGRVAVRATLESDVRGLADFLKALAADPAVLVPDDLHVTANDPGSGDGQAEVLRVEVTVTGWYLKNRATQ